jgi:hypothetical protein
MLKEKSKRVLSYLESVVNGKTDDRAGNDRRENDEKPSNKLDGDDPKEADWDKNRKRVAVRCQ